jgi:peptidyl-prolyl cis-trans isomerase C
VGWLARLARAPALHFLAIGGLLFAADAAWQDWTGNPAVPAAPSAIVVTSSEVEQLRQDLMLQNGIAPSSQQLQAAIASAVDEEILYREALAIGLDRGNAAVRQRLVQVARFVADDPDQDEEALYQMALQLGLDRSDPVVRRHLAGKMRLVAANVPLAQETPPGESELEAWLRQQPDAFMEPGRVRLTHVYLSGDRGDQAAETEARRLLAQLRATGLAPEDAPKLGDPFLLGNHLPWHTRQGLHRTFGGPFAEAAVALEPGVWSEPIRSSYGWHLVWVDDTRPSEVPPLAAVRDRVRAALLEQRREWRLRQRLTELHARYAVQVDHPPTGGTSLETVDSDG